MSHYPKFNRRPRIHPQSKRYNLPINSLEYDDDFNTSSNQSNISTSNNRRTRAPKLLLAFITLIILVGAISKQSPSGQINKIERSKNSTMAKTTSFQKRSATTKRYKHIIQDSKGKHFMKGKAVEIIGNFTNFADVTSPMKSSDVAFFWHIPRSGGSTVKHITAECLGLTQASEVGTVGGHIEDDELVAVHHIEGGKFVNVDTSTIAGLERARLMNLTSFPKLHIITSPFLIKASELFNEEHNGRVFFFLRHPVERAVSMYYHLNANDPDGNILDGKSLEQYAKSPLVENNWMTRFLSNQLGGELTEDHEAIAREFLRRKCLIGLLSHKATSMERFERYFGWRIVGQKMEHCQDQLLNWNWPSKNKHPRLKEGGVVWRSLEDNNAFDLRLYHYAHELFQEQSVLFQ